MNLNVSRLTKDFVWLSGLLVILGAAAPLDAADHTMLGGTWTLRLDREDKGTAERWFSGKLGGGQTVILPGTLPAQGIGDDVTAATPWVGGVQDPAWTNHPAYKPYTRPDDFRFPFWLQPDKYYAGVAWYQREVTIPDDWKGKRVVLRLERPHWETRVWIDGRPLGTNQSLSTPHSYDLGTGVAPGRHVLTVRVDNRVVVDVGVNSHCITDHTQGNWNGIVGLISLHATDAVWLEDVQVFPEHDNERVVVRGLIGNATGKPGQVNVNLRVDELMAGSPAAATDPDSLTVTLDKDGGAFERIIRIKKPKLWDEFTPHRYSLTVQMETNSPAKSIAFGFRKPGTHGTQFMLNGRKTFFRGTLECCIFPLTGHPPTDVDAWKRIIRIAKAHGLNMLRFHSYCPPEAAFQAADELGFYYQVETCWANQSTTLGDGKPVDAWVYAETDRILKHYGNHPSFLLMAFGNEPGGRNANAYLSKYVSHFKARDPRRLWTSGAGWPQLPENQFHVTPDPRVQAWGEGLRSRINARAPETQTDYREYIQARAVPVISHEIGQWCVYPNFDEIPKYKGYLKARNFEVFRDNLKAKGMGDLAKRFLLASGKLQTLCYKADIESALRTPGMGGFQLLDLHDFPGQGTALVGVLDPFWDPKGYVTAEEYRRFCNSTVPLARMSKRVFTTEERCTVEMEVAHFGAAPLRNALVSWSVVDEQNKTLASGKVEVPQIALGSGLPLGSAEVDLRSLPAPARYKFVLRVGSRNSAEAAFENDWDFWVYPPRADASVGQVLVVNELNKEALEKLEAGGKVLLNIVPAQVAPGPFGRVALGFSSIFWNTAWTGRQPPHTLGILCDPLHPALNGFPTEYHSNWQWWYLVSRAGAMILDDLPGEIQPIVQVIDDWVTNQKLALAFEAQVGKGKLLVTSVELGGEVSDNPVVRQFRSSLVKYMNSERFAPAAKATAAQIQALYKERTDLQKLGGRIIRASSAQNGYEPENAIDGDPQSFWHSNYDEPPAAFPHEIAVALDAPVELKGLRLTQRQGSNHNGWIKAYEVYASGNWQAWSEPVAKGEMEPTTEEQTIKFAKPVKAQFFRVVIKSGHSNGPWAAIAELNLVQ